MVELKVPAAGEAVRLQTYLKEVGYTEDLIKNRLKVGILPSHRQRTIPQLNWLTRDDAPEVILTRLFFVGLTKPAAAVRRALPGDVVDILLNTGAMREQSDGNMLPLVNLSPVWDLIIASDVPLFWEENPFDEFVLLPNPTTRALVNAALQEPVESLLDLGTGNGVIALYASRYANRVVGTDLNPRCAMFARFNAALNGITNVDFRTGDLFAPVAGEQFDRILTNPPFFISPGGEHVSCENPYELDEFCARLVRESPAYVKENGFLQMLCEWAQIGEQDWRQRVLAWVDGLDYDVLLLRLRSVPVGEYAHKRFIEIEPYRMETDEARFAEWMAYYERHGVSHVHTGGLTLRKRVAENWIRIEELKGPPSNEYGRGLRAIFNAMDWLSGKTDSVLADSHFVLSPDFRVDFKRVYANGKWETARPLIYLTMVPIGIETELLVVRLLEKLDGSCTLRAVVQTLATETGAPLEALAREATGIVRQLVQRGLVLPASAGGNAANA